MPFLPDARTAAADPATPRELRLTLQYLLANAVGENNARPINDILDHLSENGIPMTRSKFQTTVLADTRVGQIFIGSGQHGYFLIETQSDAAATLAFYNSRIASELERIRHLKELATVNHWTI